MFDVRRRSERDCEAVVTWIESAADLYRFTGARLSWPLDSSQLRQMEKLSGFSAWVLIDESRSAVVGHFDLTIHDGTARLGRVIVDPRRRGQGLSHALVEHAIGLARRLDVELLSLNVIADNEPAIRAYARSGFRPSAGSDRPDVLIMTLSLKPPNAPARPPARMVP